MNIIRTKVRQLERDLFAGIVVKDEEIELRARQELKQIYDNSKWYQFLLRIRIKMDLEKSNSNQKDSKSNNTEDYDRDESGPKMCERRYY